MPNRARAAGLLRRPGDHYPRERFPRVFPRAHGERHLERDAGAPLDHPPKVLVLDFDKSRRRQVALQASINPHPKLPPARPTAHLLPVAVAILIVIVEADDGVVGRLGGVFIGSQVRQEPRHEPVTLLRRDHEFEFVTVEMKTHGSWVGAAEAGGVLGALHKKRFTICNQQCHPIVTSFLGPIQPPNAISPLRKIV